MAANTTNTATVAEHPALVRHRLRAKLERVVDRLVAALDALDGDADHEPELGSVDGGYIFDGPDQRRWADGQNAEPSLGAVNGVSQLSTWRADTDDREDEHDGREAEPAEPSLGSSPNIDQRTWKQPLDRSIPYVDGHDHEEQEEGLGDHDEREPETGDMVPSYVRPDDQTSAIVPW